MGVVTSPFLDAAALLLVASGLAKLRSPATTARAIRALGWGTARIGAGRSAAGRPSAARAAATALGVGEIAGGALALAVGGRWSPLLIAGAYLLFGVAALQLRATAPTVGCGCFGAASAPVGVAHLTICGLGVTIGIAAAVTGALPIGALLADGVAVGVTTIVLVALLAALGYLAMTSATTLSTLRRAA